MPIAKTIEVKNTGLNATYWVISDIRFDLSGSMTWARLAGYASSAAFAGGKSAADDRSFSAATPGAFGTTQGAALVTTVYNYILTQPEFTGGSIVA